MTSVGYLEQQKDKEELVDDSQGQNNSPECRVGSQQQTVAELEHPENAEDTNGSHHSAVVDIEKGEENIIRIYIYNSC